MELIKASLSCLGTSWVCLAASWVLLRASWGCLGRRLGRVLGSLGGVLGEFQAPLRASWGVLACLEASWGSPGTDFRSHIVTYYLGCHFLTDIRPILHPKIDPRTFEKSLNSIRKICIFCFQAILR